jgi:hypothetical protein
MEKHSDFGVGLDLTLNIYTISHTSMTASHHSAIVEIHIDDTILLEVFGWYRQIDQYLEMGYSILVHRVRVQNIATHRIWVAIVLPCRWICGSHVHMEHP